MKCPYCGADLSLEDDVCSYCGAKNEAAKKYTEAMRSYSKEFHEAKGKVEETTHYIKNFVVYLIIVILLVATNLVLVIVKAKKYEIEYYIEAKEVKLNSGAYCERMEELFHKGDYYQLERLYYHKNLYVLDQMKQYDMIIALSVEYKDIFEDIRYLLGQESTKYYQTQTELIDGIGASLAKYYGMVYGDDYVSSREWLEDEGRAKIEEMTEQLECLLSHYLGLSEQQVSNFHTMSKTMISVEIGRSMGIYVEE